MASCPASMASSKPMLISSMVVTEAMLVRLSARLCTVRGNRKQSTTESRTPAQGLLWRGGGQQWDRKSVSNESLGLLVYYWNFNKKGHCKVLSEIFLIKMSHIKNIISLKILCSISLHKNIFESIFSIKTDFKSKVHLIQEHCMLPPEEPPYRYKRV